MHDRLLGALSVVFVLAAALAGCGPGNPLNRQAVGGNVTLDGAPLDHGTIEFAPQQPGGVGSGAMIESGKYSITVAQGLPPGKYLVRICSAEAGPSADNPKAPPGPGSVTPGKERIPPRYNAKSDQVVEVVAGRGNSFDFTIQTK
jgi:hypothetical protein